jgi:hypothetical protein
MEYKIGSDIVDVSTELSFALSQRLIAFAFHRAQRFYKRVREVCGDLQFCEIVT